VSLLLLRRIFPLTVLIFLALVAGSPLLAYPVTITINVTFVPIPGDSNPGNFGTTGQTGATITATVDSATGSGTSAQYQVVGDVNVTLLPSQDTIQNPSGTFTINTNGTISANFKELTAKGMTIDSFSATLVTNLFQSLPSVYTFGTASFSSPASSTAYDILGEMGTVGLSGTIVATGLTASPLTGLTASATQNGTAPASQQVSVWSTDATSVQTMDQAYTATVSPASATCQAAPWLSLTGASGTTNGTTPQTVTANFISTNLSPGTYNACILIDTISNGPGPISIPVTYTVSAPAIPTPVISSMSPNPVIAGSGQFTLTVNGSGR
jgi:hypothetical protein